MFPYLELLARQEQIRIEPSACAGFEGPLHMMYNDECEASHIVWATGGSMVPGEEMNAYVEKGRILRETREKEREI